MNNTGENERFHELAHKALAKEASPAEQRELRALIAEKPELKREMENLGGEVAVARELIEMIEDVQHPVPNIPAPPMERLSREVGAVFESRKRSKAELGDLLARLEKWARHQAGAGKDELMAMVNVLRNSYLGEASEELMADVAMLSTTPLAYAAPRLMEVAEAYALADEGERRETELKKRLRSIEERLRQAEEISRECREEMHRLLEFATQEKEISAKRRGLHSNPVPKLKK